MIRIINCPAKINLTLEVVEKTDAGFHEIRSVMIKLPGLKDELEIEIKPTESQKNKVQISCNNPEIPLDENNICHKAAVLFLKKIRKNIEIKIDINKKIPVGAGLGGGSSNAAAVFMALNDYFDKYFSRKELIEMASEIGKDIPFFFSEKNGALVGGFGEEILEEFDFSKGYFLIVNPGVHVSTPDAYGGLIDEIWFMNNSNRDNLSKKFLEALKSHESFEKYFYNDFEVSIEKKHPIIKSVKQFLLAFGADGALMSGSGSTVFGYFQEKRKMLMAKKTIESRYENFLVVEG